MTSVRTTTWLTPKAEVRSSPIEGRGLFAVGAIESGETIAVLGGEVVADAELRARQGEKYSSIALGDNRHLLLDSPIPAEYGNHSCDANTWMRDATTTEARRRIEAGEEITIDYATHSGLPEWSMACNCGAPDCRRTVTGNDWQLPAVQACYRDHFAPFLNERIRQMEGA